MERDGEDAKDEEKDDQKEEEVVDKDEEEEEEDKDGDNGIEPGTIFEGEIVNTSADNADTMVDHQSTVLPEQGQGMGEHTPRPHPLAPAPRPQTPEHCPRPRTVQTHSLSELEFSWLVRPQTTTPGAPTRREAEAAGYISDADGDQQLLIQIAGGDSLPNDSLPDVPLPNVPLPHALLREVHRDGLVGKE